MNKPSFLLTLVHSAYCAVLMFLLCGPTVSAAVEIDIPLNIDVPEEIASGSWQVTFGVPFPKNALSTGRSLVVTVDGKPVPTQTTPLATWSKRGRFVRWLLVDYQIDASRPDAVYRLRSRVSDLNKTGLAVQDSKDQLIIRTGTAVFHIQKRAPFAITSVRVDDKQLVQSEEPIRFHITDHTRQTYIADGSDEFIIEDSGPNRIGIKSAGWYVAKDGTQFCKHVTRLSFHADQSTVRLMHTFIFTGTTESHQIRDLGFDVPIAGANVATFGTSAANLSEHHQVADRDVHLTQDCEHRHALKWQLNDTATSETLKSGERFGGWMSLTGPTGGVSIAMRDAWQNYPNELEKRGNRAIVHVWPLHGRLMDFHTRAVLWPYGEQGIEVIGKFFQNRPKPYTKSLDDIYNNAMGVAKTHEIWLDFHGPDQSIEKTVELATHANTPVFATADPKWNCASGAILDPIHHYDPENFHEAENMLDAMFDRFVYWQQFYADYGWYDYGDVHNNARGDSFATQLESGPMANPWRYWDSTHYGFPNCPWTLYYRSGKRKYLQFAEANARHCMDIDRCHFGNDDDRIKGTHYYCDWSIIHWNGKPPTYVWLTTYDKLEYMAYAYYMRGDRRALDVFKDWGEAARRFHDDPDVQFPLKMLRPQFRNVRHFGPPLGNLTELYRLTWDDEYLRMARDYAKAFIEMFPDDKTFGSYFSKLQFCWEGMANYARLANDRPFIDVYRKYATKSAHRGGHRRSFADVAYAFGLTGDTSFLDLGKFRILNTASVVNIGDMSSERGTGGYWVCGNNPYAIRTLPVLLGAMMRGPKSWKNANLPLLATIRGMHLAGPRHPAVYVKADEVNAARVALQLFKNQAVELISPHGAKVKSVDSPTNYFVELSGRSFSSGWSKLNFPLRPTRRSDNYIDYGNVNIVAAQNVKMAIGPSTEDGKFCVFGSRIYFFVPEGVDQFTVRAQVSKTWAAYGWAPIVNVFDADGQLVQTKKGPGALVFDLKPQTGQRGRCWSIGPIGRVSAPWETATWRKPPYPVDKHFPSYLTLSKNLPQWVTPHPSMFEVPNVAR